jgi:hypothetical protein
MSSAPNKKVFKLTIKYNGGNSVKEFLLDNEFSVEFSQDYNGQLVPSCEVLGSYDKKTTTLCFKNSAGLPLFTSMTPTTGKTKDVGWMRPKEEPKEEKPVEVPQKRKYTRRKPKQTQRKNRPRAVSGSFPVVKRPRGRPPGSTNKSKEPQL